MITISNTVHWLSEQSRLLPDSRAIITKDCTLTYSEFYDECFMLSNYLGQFGVQEHDHVGILFGQSYKFFLLVNALWLMRAIPIPLNTRNTVKEIEYQLSQADIKHLIIEENLDGQVSSLQFKNIIRISQSSAHSLERSENSILDFQLNLPADSFSIDNPALIMFTSGSSGKSKAVVHSFSSIFESVKNLDSFANLSNNDLWLASLPLYHIGGFMILMRAILSGGTVAFPNSLKHESLAEALTVFDPTHVSFVSTTLNRFIKDDFEPSKKLKCLFLGGGPSSPEQCLQAIDKGWLIVKVYGSTETCSMVTALLPNEVKQKPNSVGKALGMNKIKIKSMSKNDPNDFCSDGEVGEIVVSAQALFREYYKDQLTTDKVLKNGWYHTGDYGWLDKDNFLYISSRFDDLIISGGENINANDVQEVLMSNSLIDDVFVFGLNDETWDQIVCAAIVSKKISELEIINFLKENIAGYKIPKQFFFIESLPKNEMGKVNRTELLIQLNLS